MSLSARSPNVALDRPVAARPRRAWPTWLRPDLQPPGVAPTRSSRAPLLAYLNDLEAWSHRVWTAAGLSRSWLPHAIRRELHHQWWASSVVPSAPALRARIASFWIDVTPWVAGNAGVEPLPNPPSDPELIAEMRRAIERELDRNGTTGLGEDRSTALWRTSLQLERLGSAPLAS